LQKMAFFAENLILCLMSRKSIQKELTQQNNTKAYTIAHYAKS